jgi:ectoine hydroxylase-related dioxygenase (phytanoyl-CoA dioxygenase family)
VWSTTDLLVSMDAVIAWRPWRLDESWRPQTEGLHMDQNPFTKPKLECVQGMMPLIDVTAHSGGLQVVPRSHSEEVQARLRESYSGWGGDWCPLRNDDTMTARAVLLLASAGDLILWDSRTVHGGMVGTDATTSGAMDESGNSGRTQQETQLVRLSVTVAMTPRARASEQVQSLRRAGFAWGVNHSTTARTRRERLRAPSSAGYQKLAPVPS